MRNPSEILGIYDYATIAYDDLRTGPSSSASNYCRQQQLQQSQQQYYFDRIPPVTFLPGCGCVPAISPHFRPPPNFPPPPPPPASALTGNSSTQISATATTARLSEDSAYSESSASPLHYHGEVMLADTSQSGMLLRMDLSRNPPVFVQGI
ncbi:unnamed protein product [Gongylonema pulchrum]|uniref:Velvet domain-containing protein n=1 Tax=Gongylonema pulchrum TaxID=637853 RepID=A0A183DDQ1_9BILA|nr:unnamed protein product [Gongylonema pulchrum]